MSVFAYDLGMASLDQFIDDRLLQGRAYFNREEALAAVDLNPELRQLGGWIRGGNGLADGPLWFAK